MCLNLYKNYYVKDKEVSITYFTASFEEHARHSKNIKRELLLLPRSSTNLPNL